MRIKWLGHACFKITFDNGVRILTDPFDDNVGYQIPAVETDIVTLSHNHYDHNFVDCVKGKFEVINKVGNFYLKDISITGVHTYHDEVHGAKRGDNIVYIFEYDGVRLCHLGDLGHILTPSQIGMIDRVDVLLIPVGGVYTINSEEAIQVTNQLKPSIIIPMHYKTPALRMNIDSVDKFANGFRKVEKIQSQVLEVKKDELNKDEPAVYILKYE